MTIAFPSVTGIGEQGRDVTGTPTGEGKILT